MDQFDEDIEALKQKAYNAGYVDAYRDIYDDVQRLTILDGRYLYRAIDRLFDHIRSVIYDGKIERAIDELFDHVQSVIVKDGK